MTEHFLWKVRSARLPRMSPIPQDGMAQWNRSQDTVSIQGAWVHGFPSVGFCFLICKIRSVSLTLSMCCCCC